MTPVTTVHYAIEYVIVNYMLYAIEQLDRVQMDVRQAGEEQLVMNVSRLYSLINLKF